MTVDPIVDEVHEARARILSLFDGDVRRYAGRLLERKGGAGLRITTLEQLRRGPVPRAPDAQGS